MSVAAPSLTPVGAPQPFGPVVLAIMDGVGLGRGKDDAGDAVAAAATPNLDALRAGPLSCSLRAHGTAVGMPSNADMGNSEVGHNAMGAGRVVDQGAKRVGEAVASGALLAAPAWKDLVAELQKSDGALHLLGLLSDGNVHSHIDHLLALIAGAQGAGLRRVYVHALLDGRDVAPQSALPFVERLEACLAAAQAAVDGSDYAIASGGGRMRITMDRYEADWAMVARGWRTHVLGEVGDGDDDPRGCARLAAGIAAHRAAFPDCTDQELPPLVVLRGGHAVGPIEDGDAVIAFNFRGDRMLEMVRAFEEETFSGFARPHRPQVRFVGMTQYDGDTQRPRTYLVSPPSINATLSELLCAQGVRQWACSETQKFGHVTYFWNGNRSGAFDPRLEAAVEIPSLPPPFDAQPGMRAPQIAAAVADALASEAASFYRVNFPNGDMVGHTGNLAATVAAMEAVDAALGALRTAVHAHRGTLVVTGDHGNAEQMLEKDAAGNMRVKTSHTLNPVPLLIEGTAICQAVAAKRLQFCPHPDAGLANLAATLCTLLGYRPPALYLPGLLRALE